jgi:hypothetical protein
MSKYLTPRAVGGTMAIAICYRCQMKMYAGDLKKDPNTGAYYCEDCVDIFDPWRLPSRQTENITVRHPRPDVSIATDGTTVEPPAVEEA